MKRIRGNGGSRSSLRPEGIVIFGQYDSHRRVAETLGLPVPGPGESVSVRLAGIGPGSAPLRRRSALEDIDGSLHNQMTHLRWRRSCPASERYARVSGKHEVPKSPSSGHSNPP